MRLARGDGGADPGNSVVRVLAAAGVIVASVRVADWLVGLHP
ncbi:hypothetical protein ACXYX3_15125 [Mycobacterium sp. C3-094]|nr:hypothetical protein [Mycobacterium sp. PSTR-4-N]